MRHPVAVLVLVGPLKGKRETRETRARPAVGGGRSREEEGVLQQGAGKKKKKKKKKKKRNVEAPISLMNPAKRGCKEKKRKENKKNEE